MVRIPWAGPTIGPSTAKLRNPFLPFFPFTSSQFTSGCSVLASSLDQLQESRAGHERVILIENEHPMILDGLDLGQLVPIGDDGLPTEFIDDAFGRQIDNHIGIQP